MIIHGDCLEKLKEMAAESVDCVITSPPYYGLRNYGVDGQLGLENSYQEYINNSNHWEYNFLAIKKTVDTLCKLAGIPVWHFSNFAELNIITDVDGIWPARPNYKISDINELNLIAGRDYEFGPECSHPGIQMNNDIYKKWKQKYKNNG